MLLTFIFFVVKHLNETSNSIIDSYSFIPGENDCCYGNLLSTMESLMSKTLALRAGLSEMTADLPDVIVQVGRMYSVGVSDLLAVTLCDMRETCQMHNCTFVHYQRCCQMLPLSQVFKIPHRNKLSENIRFVLWYCVSEDLVQSECLLRHSPVNSFHREACFLHFKRNI